MSRDRIKWRNILITISQSRDVLVMTGINYIVSLGGAGGSGGGEGGVEIERGNEVDARG